MLGGAAGIWLSYHLANRRPRGKAEVIDPVVEKQYRTAPPRTVADEPIDVTPSHLRDKQQ
jgi:hypothetical protein